MKYAIFLRDRRKVDAPQIEEYCAVSAFYVDETVVFKNFTNVCRHFKSGDTVIIANILTLGRRYGEICNNIKLLAEHGVILFCVQGQILLNTTQLQSINKLTDVFLQLYKNVLSIRNKGIQDNLLKAGRMRGAPAYKQEYLNLHKEKIKTLLKSGEGVLQIFELLDCSYRTLYRYMKEHPELQNG